MAWLRLAITPLGVVFRVLPVLGLAALFTLGVILDTATAQDPRRDPRGYRIWCGSQGGTIYSYQGSLACRPGSKRPQEAGTTTAPPRPTPDYQLEQRRREAERQRREQDRKRAFERAKREALGLLKGSAPDSGGVKSSGGGDLKLKSGTPTFGLKGNPDQGLTLKPSTPPAGTRTVTKPSRFSKGTKYSAPVVTDPRAVRMAQGRLETRDPAWLKSVRNAALQTARSEHKFAHDLTRSFRANKPPKPEAIRSLGALKAGEIILVNSEKPGGFADLVQGFLDRKISGRRHRAPASHAFVYLGMSGGSRLFLDNQWREGPRIIGETEFRQRYSHRQLFTARPTMPLDGTELFRAAVDYARSNEAAIKRGHGFFGTKYGVFGKDNLVCSETALFAVARASKGALESLTHDLRAKKSFDIIQVTPGDIYDQDGNGYFTVRSLQLDGSRAKR